MTRLEPFLLTLDPACLSLSMPLKSSLWLGFPSPVYGLLKFESSSLVPDFVHTGFTTAPKGLVRVEFTLFASGTARPGMTPSILDHVTIGSTPSPRAPCWLGSLLPVSGMSRSGMLASSSDFIQSRFPSPLRLPIHPEPLALAFGLRAY